MNKLIGVTILLSGLAVNAQAAKSPTNNASNASSQAQSNAASNSAVANNNTASNANTSSTNQASNASSKAQSNAASSSAVVSAVNSVPTPVPVTSTPTPVVVIVPTPIAPTPVIVVEQTPIMLVDLIFAPAPIDPSSLYTTVEIPSLPTDANAGLEAAVVQALINPSGVTPLTIATLNSTTVSMSANEAPVPGAVWLFGSALTSLLGFGKRRRS
ncbi:hypothetical protein [Methyloglobulus sp.]|uniref:hypothetical protein n=1 Tax=Methyloglobulus sp. TaxID=2518622 RepID=UPI0032B7DFF9